MAAEKAQLPQAACPVPHLLFLTPQPRETHAFSAGPVSFRAKMPSMWLSWSGEWQIRQALRTRHYLRYPCWVALGRSLTVSEPPSLTSKRKVALLTPV